MGAARVVAAALVVVLTVGCGTGGDDLAVLHTLSVSDLEIAGAERVDRHESADRPGSSFSKPSYAKVTQVYRPADDATFEALVAAVEAAGWDLEPGHQDRYRSAEGEIEDLTVRVAVYVADAVNPPAVVVAVSGR